MPKKPSSSSEEHEGRSSSSEEREGLCSSTEEHEELLINNPKTQPDPKPRKPTQRKKNKKTRRGRKRPKIRQKRDVKPPMDTGLAETKLVTWIMSERKLSERSSYTKNYSVMTKVSHFFLIWEMVEEIRVFEVMWHVPCHLLMLFQ